ncbi:hypothetical protein I6N91_15100 [Arthrobacter sp. MSA 4-2]|uniref:hypothetical protein n=1 Tax=Arthrobacter sp. MSA 4-2 TaxID=2794349 RepID=UPI0018E83A7B|nr:hypothetical protein [Arthrobacter sp. MSA 4-2]MBJ2122309.1 hypothetical protein [Arthrobacter sp. MSA 4-2]
MSFFDDIPAPPPPPQRHRVPSLDWVRPPSDELPVVLPVGRFLWRGGDTVVGVSHVEAYSTGCSIRIRWMLRRGSRTDGDWDTLLDRWMGQDRHSVEVLRFGVGLPDGQKVSTQNAPRSRSGSVTGPVLMAQAEAGASKSAVTGSVELWLYPLPSVGELLLVVEGALLGIPESTMALDAGEIRGAAQRSWAFWDSARQ